MNTYRQFVHGPSNLLGAKANFPPKSIGKSAVAEQRSSEKSSVITEQTQCEDLNSKSGDRIKFQEPVLKKPRLNSLNQKTMVKDSITSTYRDSIATTVLDPSYTSSIFEGSYVPQTINPGLIKQRTIISKIGKTALERLNHDDKIIEIPTAGSNRCPPTALKNIPDDLNLDLLEMQKLILTSHQLLPKRELPSFSETYTVDGKRRGLEIITEALAVLSLLEVKKCDLETLEFEMETAPAERESLTHTSATASAKIKTDDKKIVERAAWQDISDTTKSAPECMEYMNKFEKNCKADDIVFISSNSNSQNLTKSKAVISKSPKVVRTKSISPIADNS